MNGKPRLQALPRVKRNGVELQAHLAEALGLSRRAAKKIVDERRVFVNGRRIWMARHPLEVRDAVEIAGAAVPEGGAEGRAKELAVLAEGKGWRVVDKPCGMTATGERSAESLLRETTGNPAIAAVHRLDRDTTGCLLFAEDEATRRALVASFEEGRVTKVYRALAAGVPEKDAFAVSRPLDGQAAESAVRVLARRFAAPRACHLAVKIDTGRTHQIRRHLLAAGFPVLGDRRYFSQASRAFAAVPRQMLHAARLGFPDPETGKTVFAVSPLPADFKRLLRELGLR
ncbi:MAG: RluA family pseudouridine synthase [Kiritimatiellae bacterium]|nr:RluA family pseudouridine synthase [Kiritimatiellia bacterium]